jgi:ATP-binding protein involved in chromosome partitioning
MSITREAALAALGTVKYPDLPQSLVDLNLAREVEVAPDGAVALTVVIVSPEACVKDRLERDVTDALSSRGATAVRIAWHKVVLGRDASSEDPLPDVKNVVLVMSGKGGVGKSTVAANAAAALARSGAHVGLLDADIYGPSVPTMFAVKDRPEAIDDHQMEPIEKFGVKLMSIGFLIEDPTTAIVWRGPMLNSALLQFMKDVRWGTLDYLLVDLPPGTGDIALTLSQQIGSPAAVIVTTPQEVALQDVYKAVSMCRKVGIGVVGVIENESSFVCDGCGKHHDLFGHGGGRKVADFAEAPLIGQIPIDMSVRESGDTGTPVVLAAGTSAAAAELRGAADRLAHRIGIGHLSRLGSLGAGPAGGSGRRRLPVVR